MVTTGAMPEVLSSPRPHPEALTLLGLLPGARTHLRWAWSGSRTERCAPAGPHGSRLASGRANYGHLAGALVCEPSGGLRQVYCAICGDRPAKPRDRGDAGRGPGERRDGGALVGDYHVDAGKTGHNERLIAKALATCPGIPARPIALTVTRPMVLVCIKSLASAGPASSPPARSRSRGPRGRPCRLLCSFWNNGGRVRRMPPGWCRLAKTVIGTADARRLDGAGPTGVSSLPGSSGLNRTSGGDDDGRVTR